MPLTITLSGPTESVQGASDALAASDFTVLDDYDHGLPPEPDTAFVSINGEDMNLANDIGRPFGYRLRQHLNAASSVQVARVPAWGAQG